MRTRENAKPAPANESERARRGKIARLPHSVREALNQRLLDGAPASKILPWLNALPETREAMERHFDGSPITADNLSWWRRGGFAGWVEHQQAKETMHVMSAAGRNFDQEEIDVLTDNLSLVVMTRMVGELRRFDALPDGQLKSAAWQKLVWSLVLFRRSQFYAVKMRLDRDKLKPKKGKERKLSIQERKERMRMVLGIGGPHWNNFTKRWEGEGAEEEMEKEEIERMVREEMRRRKAAREAEADKAAEAAENAEAGQAGQTVTTDPPSEPVRTVVDGDEEQGSTGTEQAKIPARPAATEAEDES